MGRDLQLKLRGMSGREINDFAVSSDEIIIEITKVCRFPLRSSSF